MGFSPESYTFMTMGRRHRAESQTKLGVISDWWLVIGVKRELVTGCRLSVTGCRLPVKNGRWLLLLTDK